MIESWSWLTSKVCVAILRQSYSNSPCYTALISEFSSQSWSETMTELMCNILATQQTM